MRHSTPRTNAIDWSLCVENPTSFCFCGDGTTRKYLPRWTSCLWIQVEKAAFNWVSMSKELLQISVWPALAAIAIIKCPTTCLSLSAKSQPSFHPVWNCLTITVVTRGMMQRASWFAPLPVKWFLPTIQASSSLTLMIRQVKLLNVASFRKMDLFLEVIKAIFGLTNQPVIPRYFFTKQTQLETQTTMRNWLLTTQSLQWCCLQMKTLCF